jgi:phenylacetate-CoA ligase
MEGRKYFDPEIETMDRPNLEKLQMERLLWQLKRCYEESPFYRERLEKAGIKPEDIRSMDDILHIPPVTKQELREEQLFHPPLGRYTVAPRKDWGELHPSTGTTGVPGGSFTHRREPREFPSIRYGLTGMSRVSAPGRRGLCGISVFDPAISSKMHSAMGYG